MVVASDEDGVVLVDGGAVPGKIGAVWVCEEDADDIVLVNVGVHPFIAQCDGQLLARNRVNRAQDFGVGVRDNLEHEEPGGARARWAHGERAGCNGAHCGGVICVGEVRLAWCGRVVSVSSSPSGNEDGVVGGTELSFEVTRMTQGKGRGGNKGLLPFEGNSSSVFPRKQSRHISYHTCRISRVQCTVVLQTPVCILYRGGTRNSAILVTATLELVPPKSGRHRSCHVSHTTSSPPVSSLFLAQPRIALDTKTII